ncbi:MAG: bifunctional chorismate mutase/prephenate dehydrogenase [Balneolaceae bacterium]|nr:bifunctional chorismate mutase/prephenate dehydrogenase [Balneolaceae bacterium]MBO6545533.1 bifunctional chorismate mutase/prephenate dehydrogenase [Balneolaceae bacterium]MBO6646929.1 bifunctional chorismate mutase/prephenate dehydrogenase [Balneolaceae bacterium]
MPHRHKELESPRKRIDEIDEEILDLLAERSKTVQDVIKRKVENQLPVFVPEREIEKSESFKRMAHQKGIDPEWAEDFLRMIMSSSRDSQSQEKFPIATEEPMHILYIGGEGGMGKLYQRITRQTGHHTYSIDKGNWHELEELSDKLDMVIVTVPINVTEQVIQRLSGRLRKETILADFTSNKSKPMQAMLKYHKGPVLGLHPMHGPDVENLSKQLMVVCPARDGEKADWFIKQCELWGMRIVEAEPEKHDHVMHLVQGLRHFVALLHGSFMEHYDLKPADMLDYSSPIYRAELMMTGRIFAQSAELYADIVFSNKERRELLLNFFEHHKKLAELVEKNDREGFIREFEGVTDFFGKFATQALTESGYLINRLADRFA